MCKPPPSIARTVSFLAGMNIQCISVWGSLKPSSYISFIPYSVIYHLEIGVKGLLSIVETPDKNLLPFRSDPGIPEILLSARRGPSPSVRRVEMEGVQGKGREDVGEENWQGLHSGTALPLVVQMLREGSANLGPCGSRWTETSQGRERGSGRCWQLVRCGRRGSLPGKPIHLLLSRRALGLGPSGRA